jgi:N-methylhydantoinase B
MPIFENGKVLGFICNIAHHADFGGMTPGSMGGGMTEIYQEGLRVPLVKLQSAGRLNQDIYDLILLNTRVPEERRGDLNAQIAAARLGVRRFAEVIGRYGGDVLTAAFDEIIQRTEIRMRHAVSQIPDGVYPFRDVMDDDGCGNCDLPIQVTVTIDGDRLEVDFAGTALQTAGNINCTPSATLSAIAYTMKALLDPEVANNQGVLNVCEWSAPEGTLVNANFPASVANRAHTCQRIIDALLGALAPALPDKVVGAGNGANTTAVFTGIDPSTGRRYIYFETLGGGFGGRSTHDGKDGVQVHITNTSNLPIEAIEMEYPLRVVEYGLVPDSGGAGRFRGGLALRRVLSPIGHVCTFSGSSERFRSRPWGVFGGREGRNGRFIRLEPDGTETELPSKPAGVTFDPEQMIAIETPGSGGYGDPRRRDRALIEQDRVSEKFSDIFIARHYG